MTSTDHLNNNHISILYNWNKWIRFAPIIHRETRIPLTMEGFVLISELTGPVALKRSLSLRN